MARGPRDREPAFPGPVENPGRLRFHLASFVSQGELSGSRRRHGFPRDLSIVEMDGSVPNDLVGLVALAGYQDNVTLPRILNRPENGRAPVGKFHVWALR